MVYLAVHTVQDERDMRSFRNYLLDQGLWYPHFDRWVETVCVPDIERRWKTAILARDRRGDIVGNVVFQAHKELARTRELKNLRIKDAWRRRDLGHFLLRQAEEEDAVVDGQRSFDQILCDCDARAEGMLWLLAFSGYREIMRRPLYSRENMDVILVKDFEKKDPLQAALHGRN